MATQNPTDQDSSTVDDLASDRSDPKVARDLIERLVPDSGARLSALSLLVKDIRRANVVSSASWGVTLHHNEVRLNVGPLETLVLRNDELQLTVDQAAANPERWKQIEQHPLLRFKWKGKPFQLIPTAYGVSFPVSRIDELLYLVQEPHASLVDKAAGMVRTRTQFFYTHSPGVLAYLQQELDADVPAPDYGLEGTAAQAWLFQANPDIWNLARELRTVAVGDEDDWSVSRYGQEMRPGDTVLLWQGGAKAGIYAVAELTGHLMERPTAEFWPDRDQRPPTEPAVPYRYIRILEEPIDRADLQQHPILRNLQVLRAPQGTNFKVTQEEWAALQEMLELSGPTASSRVWIEKTNIRGRPDREQGEYALGKALWSPTRGKTGADVYRFMREVKPGDAVLHLTDNAGFTGVRRLPVVLRNSRASPTPTGRENATSSGSATSWPWSHRSREERSFRLRTWNNWTD